MRRNVRTDLALEARELAEGEIPGVEFETEEGDITVSRVKITSPEGEKRLGKPQGTYITIEAPGLPDRDPEYEERVSMHIARELRSLVKLPKDAEVMLVGLGNWNVTPDSLGPKVIEGSMVTRHIFNYVPDQVDERMRPVCAFSPGVLGITGIETGEIVRGIVENVKPALVIAIDSLAAMRSERIGTTVQIADTGISPGSGIGNKRMGLNKDSLGVPTIAIGVPMVVYAKTLSEDMVSEVIDKAGLTTAEKQRLQRTAENVLSKKQEDLVVTPKEIDLLIEDIAGLVADGINLALHELNIDEINKYLH